jgi:hypothetical protein
MMATTLPALFYPALNQPQPSKLLSAVNPTRQSVDDGEEQG